MSLQEAIEDLKKEIADKEKEPEEVIEEVVEAPEEEPVVEEKEEEKPEAPKVEEKPDDAGHMRLRREAAAAKKQAEAEVAKREALEAKLAELENPLSVQEEAPISPEFQELLQDNRMRKAEREFESLEAKFRTSNPDYDAVAGQYAQALAQSIKIQNPRLGNSEIAERTKQALLTKAGAHVRAGFDPIEELYHEAKELGFTGKQAKPKEEVEEELKPDMSKLAANRKKSAGMAAASGKSEGQLTKQAALELTNAEWSKLPAAEKRRLLSS